MDALDLPQKIRIKILCKTMCLPAPHLRSELQWSQKRCIGFHKAHVLAPSTAHVLRLSTKICPVFTANTKEAAFGRLHKGGRPSAATLCGFLCVGCEHWGMS